MSVFQLPFKESSFKEFINEFNQIDIRNPKWGSFWDYLVFADDNYQRKDYRFAILDLDIVCDITARAFISKKLNLSDEIFLKLTNKKSSGDLIDIALLICDETMKVDFCNLKNLHEVRNNILHNYQRNVNDSTFSVYTEAKRSVVNIHKTL